MFELNPDQLIPGETYLLKWSATNKNNTVNIVILECEFLHHYDNQYAAAYLNLKIEGELDASLTGTILDEQGLVIQREFDHPLYPYSDARFFSRPIIKGIGLFRVIRLYSTTFNSITSNEEQGLKNNKYDSDPFKFLQLPLSTNNNTGNKIIMGETLLWVNLDKVKIIKSIREKVLNLQKEAVEGWMSQVSDVTRDPSGVAENVKTYLGGRKRKTRRKSKRNNKRKGKRSRTNKK